MPLIQCPECSGTISSHAIQCPHCDVAFESEQEVNHQRPIKILIVGGLVILALIITIFAFSCRNTSDNKHIENKSNIKSSDTMWMSNLNLSPKDERNICPLATARFWNRWLAIREYDLDMLEQLLEADLTAREGLYLLMSNMRRQIDEEEVQLQVYRILDEELVDEFQKYIEEDEEWFEEFERITSRFSDNLDGHSFRELAEKGLDTLDKKRPAESKEQENFLQRLRRYEEKRMDEIIALFKKLQKKYPNQTFRSPLEMGE